MSLKQTLDSRALLQSMLELSNYTLELLEEIRQLFVLTLLSTHNARRGLKVISSSFLPSCQPVKRGADLSLTFEISWDRNSQLIGVSTLCQLASWEVLVFSGSFATFSSSWLLTPVRWPGFPREGIKLFGVMLVALMSLKCCLVSVGHFPYMHTENIPSPVHFPPLHKVGAF